MVYSQWSEARFQYAGLKTVAALGSLMNTNECLHAHMCLC